MFMLVLLTPLSPSHKIEGRKELPTIDILDSKRHSMLSGTRTIEGISRCHPTVYHTKYALVSTSTGNDSLEPERSRSTPILASTSTCPGMFGRVMIIW